MNNQQAKLILQAYRLGGQDATDPLCQEALEIGCDGVISSGIEAPKLRGDLGGNFLIISPGIRPVENTLIDDQKRTVDVEQAFLNGADYIVIGRPIRKAPNPKAKAEEIQSRISRLFDGSRAGGQ